MIYLTGDFHGKPQRLFTSELQALLQAGDYVIVCGDFSMIWGGPMEDTLNGLLNRIEQAPYTLLFLDGNHENFDLLNAFPVKEFCGGRVHQVRKNILHLMRGEIFTLSGQTFFCLGGAATIDKVRRTTGYSWWPEEIPSAAEIENARHNLQRYHYQVDYVITHTAPDRFISAKIPNFNFKKDPCPVRLLLNELEPKITYKRWFFGHLHKDWECQDPRCTWMYREIRPLA